MCVIYEHVPEEVSKGLWTPGAGGPGGYVPSNLGARN